MTDICKDILGARNYLVFTFGINFLWTQSKHNTCEDQDANM